MQWNYTGWLQYYGLPPPEQKLASNYLILQYDST